MFIKLINPSLNPSELRGEGGRGKGREAVNGGGRVVVVLCLIRREIYFWSNKHEGFHFAEINLNWLYSDI